MNSQKQYRILIVDDDPDIREVLSILLRSEGYDAVQAENGGAAVEKVYADPAIDLVILDIMMPGVNGVEACAMIRRKSKIPVIFLTAKSQDQDKIDAYTEGGDDYLVKPFSRTELLMKVKALLRRYNEYRVRPVEPEVTTINDSVRLDDKRRLVLKGDQKIPLTEKEYAIMRYFLDHRGNIVENRALYEGVWNESYLPSDGNTVMVHILNLRKKLEDDATNPQIIRTIWGKGYRVE